MKILMVLTSHDVLGTTGLKTGFWLEEFAAPYFVFREAFYNSGKPVALVCHSPGVLRHVTYKGEPLVKGKRVTGFTNGEETEMQLAHIVPILVEDELLRLGAVFAKRKDWDAFAITDGRLITGQNPASSTSAAKALLELRAKPAASWISVELSQVA